MHGKPRPDGKRITRDRRDRFEIKPFLLDICGIMHQKPCAKYKTHTAERAQNTFHNKEHRPLVTEYDRNKTKYREA